MISMGSSGFLPITKGSLADINRANEEAWNQRRIFEPLPLLHPSIHLIGITQDGDTARNVYEWNGQTYTATVGANLDSEGVPSGMRLHPHGLPVDWVNDDQRLEAKMTERNSVHR